MWGVESAHKSEETAETGARLVREGYRSHKLKPYRKAAQAEQKLEKANVNALYQKSLRENPQLASNPLSPLAAETGYQKRIRCRQTRRVKLPEIPPSTAKKTGKAAKTVKEKAQEAGGICHAPTKRGFLIAGAIFLLGLYAAQHHVLLLCVESRNWFGNFRNQPILQMTRNWWR